MARKAGSSNLVGRAKTDSLYERFRTQIEMMRPGQRLATERDLAEQHGVSYSTLRRVMNRLRGEGYIYKVRGKGTFVAERTDEAKRDVPGVLYADPWIVQGNLFFIRCLQGVLDESQRQGLRLQVFRCTDHSFGMPDVDQLLKEAKSGNVRGLLLPYAKPEIVARIFNDFPDMRIATMSTRYPPSGIASVILDYAAIGYNSVQHLADKGAQRIVVAAATTMTIDGVRTAQMELANHGQEIDVQVVNVTQHDPAGYATLAKQIMACDPDGIAFDDDRHTVATIPSLKQLQPGLLRQTPIIAQANEGEDILPPEIARLVVDSYEIGVVAMQILRRMVTENRSIGLVTHVEPRLQLPAADNV